MNPAPLLLDSSPPESEAMLASLLDAPLVVMDASGRIEFLNRAAAEFWSAGENWTGSLLMTRIRLTPEGSALAAAFSAVRRGERRAAATTTRADRVIDWSFQASGDDRIVLIGHDVTARAEEADKLKRTIQRQDAILNNMTDFAWIKDRQSRFVAVNQALADFTGVTREEMIGRVDADFFPAEIAAAYTAGDAHVSTTRAELRSLETITSPDGRERTIETIKNPVFDEAGDLIGVSGVARDVTQQEQDREERRDLLRRLAEQHQRLSDTIQNVPGVVWEEWLDGSSRYVSNAVEEMLGYSRKEYLRNFDSFLAIVHPDDRAAASRRTEEMIASGRGGTHEFRVVRRDGSIAWCESHCSLILDGHGRVAGLRGVSMDVTERKHADTLLRTSEERFRQLVDSAPVMLWMTDSTGAITFVSRQLLEFLGRPSEGVQQHGWLSSVHPDDLQRVAATVEDAVSARSTLRYEMRCLRGDGEYRELMIEGVPRFSEDGTYLGLVGNSTDLTDLRRLERRMDESRRLSSLGRLAATIAHEINNVLMGVQPFADVIDSTACRDTVANAVQSIKRSVERGRRVTHEILRFANTGAPQPRCLDAAEWLGEHLDELRGIAGKSVSIDTRVEQGLRVFADPVQMQQVLTNLVANARDAMDGEGRIEITVSRGTTFEQRPAVEFAVADTGCGMSGEVLDQIFEPLFTTKRNGTGIGLALVRDIIDRHNGEIAVESSTGRGTKFRLRLPASEAAPDSAPSSPELPALNVRRVVLVEDDPAVSSGLTMLLELHGLDVAVAERGADAVPVIDAFQPDVVLLDVGLPDLPGTEVFENIRAVHPDLPIVFSTGHGGELQLKEYLRQPQTGYLLKPYTVEALLSAIAAIT